MQPTHPFPAADFEVVELPARPETAIDRLLRSTGGFAVEVEHVAARLELDEPDPIDGTRSIIFERPYRLEAGATYFLRQPSGAATVQIWRDTEDGLVEADFA